MSKKSFSLDIKMLALQHLEEGRHTFREIATMFSVDVKTLQIVKPLEFTDYSNIVILVKFTMTMENRGNNVMLA